MSCYYATKIVLELTETVLQNPSVTKLQKNVTRGVGINRSLEEEVFLLALRIECPSHPNTDYVAKLKDFYDRDISAVTTISVWFHECYDYTGTFKVPNLVLIDKWMMRNATWVMVCRTYMDLFPNHSKWNFLDEKHIMNRDVLPKKIRADPLTGYVDAIPVSGDFRDAHNIFAIVSGSPTKKSSIAYAVYHITEENGNATISSYFDHNKILVMDNTQIHRANKADCVKFYLWNTVISGLPLHVKIVYLPTRCPELNPIEFMFHLLSNRIRSFW
jgi:hypothetical protein